MKNSTENFQKNAIIYFSDPAKFKLFFLLVFIRDFLNQKS